MSKRKGLSAEPNVRIEDILAARDGKYIGKHQNQFFVYNRFVSYGENMWYERNGDYSIEITQDSHTESKIHRRKKANYSKHVEI